MTFTFILVAPQLPENVGAAARALNTMGFDHLRLVKPCDHLDERARWVAHASEHILENALVFDDFADSIRDLDFVIGATARRRGKRQEYFAGEQLPQLILSKGNSIQNIGVVFGREDRGLLNDEIEKCDALVALNMFRPQPSLNLAQAVMVFAYILSPFVLEPLIASITPPQAAEFKSLKERLQTIFENIGLQKNHNIVNRLFERMAYFTEEDVHLLHSVCAKLERKIESGNDVS